MIKRTNQKYLHSLGLLILLGVLSMTTPLANDMYLPSFPGISEDLNTTSSLVSFTLVVFNIFLAVGIILVGPISDKFGRKKPLVASLILFAIGNLICFAAPDIWVLIVGRVIQSFGAGGMISLALAIVKDSYEPQNRGKIIAILQSFTIIGPIIAPIIGAIILQFATWRYVFLLLFVIAVAQFIAVMFYQESIPKNEINTGSIKDTFVRIFVVAKNVKFSLILAVGALYFTAFFAYIACASFVYEDFFGLTEAQFSIFFAVNAGLSLFGPLLSVVLEKKFSIRWSINILFFFAFLSMGLVFAFGQISVFAFLLTYVIYAIANSVLRPYITNVLLNIHDGDTGSATALINFIYTILGAVGMFIGSLPFPNFVLGVAFSMLIFLGLAFIVWIPTSKSLSK